MLALYSKCKKNVNNSVLNSYNGRSFFKTIDNTMFSVVTFSGVNHRLLKKYMDVP